MSTNVNGSGVLVAPADAVQVVAELTKVIESAEELVREVRDAVVCGAPVRRPVSAVPVVGPLAFDAVGRAVEALGDVVGRGEELGAEVTAVVVEAARVLSAVLVATDQRRPEPVVAGGSRGWRREAVERCRRLAANASRANLAAAREHICSCDVDQGADEDATCEEVDSAEDWQVVFALEEDGYWAGGWASWVAFCAEERARGIAMPAEPVEEHEAPVEGDSWPAGTVTVGVAR